MISDSIVPSPEFNLLASSKVAGFSLAIASVMLPTKVWNCSFLETKSVSELISVKAAMLPSA